MTIKELKISITSLFNSGTEFTLNYLNEDKNIIGTNPSCKINVVKKTKFSVALNANAVVYVDYDSENSWILHENSYTKMLNKGYIQLVISS